MESTPYVTDASTSENTIEEIRDTPHGLYASYGDRSRYAEYEPQGDFAVRFVREFARNRRNMEWILIDWLLATSGWSMRDFEFWYQTTRRTVFARFRRKAIRNYARALTADDRHRPDLQMSFGLSFTRDDGTDQSFNALLPREFLRFYNISALQCTDLLNHMGSGEYNFGVLDLSPKNRNPAVEASHTTVAQNQS